MTPRPRPDLYSPRFRLRLPAPADTAMLAEIDMDPEVMRYITDEPLTYERALRWAKLRIELDSYRWNLGIRLIEDRATSELHGWVTLQKLDWMDEIELGYRLRRASWGRGIATEASTRMLEYGFGEAGLDHVAAVTHPDNAASQRVLAKLGFRYEKMVRAYEADLRYYTLVRPGLT